MQLMFWCKSYEWHHVTARAFMCCVYCTAKASECYLISQLTALSRTSCMCAVHCMQHAGER